MKLTFISDTHTRHRELTDDLPGGDILFHCGDIMGSGYKTSEILDFCDWLESDVKNKYKHIVVIAGNHDRVFELNSQKDNVEKMIEDIGVIYLNDSGIKLEGLNIWGSPVQPAFCNWAFNRSRGSEIKQYWDLIPSDTDVLLTHGPPFGILDRCPDGSLVGCEDLLEKIKEVKPKICAFGHIHDCYGIKEQNGITFINASNLDERYKYTNKPITVDIS